MGGLGWLCGRSVRWRDFTHPHFAVVCSLITPDFGWGRAENSVAARTAYCFVTVMLFAVVVSVYPAVLVVNDPLSEPNVRAVYI